MNNPLLADWLTSVAISAVVVFVPLALSRRMRAVLREVLDFRSPAK